MKVTIMVLALFITGASSAGDKPVELEPREHQVEIKGFLFVPDSIDVKPGDTITWTNRDLVPHTATASDKSWDTGLINKDESKSIVVSPGMDSDYFCLFHPTMVAKVEMIEG